MEPQVDFLIVGSGFGGSVSALRLVEKGYSVTVLEAGRRWRPEDFPKTNRRFWDYLWAPAIGCTGIQRVRLLTHFLALSGAEAGGGSLVYACTLIDPLDPFFRAPQWADLDPDWKATLAPRYATARRRGAARIRPGDRPRAHLQADAGRNLLHRRARADRPGPLLRRRGATAIREDGAGGYLVETRRGTSALPRGRRTWRARQVVVAAGALGTLELLLVMQVLDNSLRVVYRRSLPRPWRRVLKTEAPQDGIPTYLPEANACARVIAKKIGGVPGKGA